jgi:hypothetical protein
MEWYRTLCKGKDCARQVPPRPGSGRLATAVALVDVYAMA